MKRARLAGVLVVCVGFASQVAAQDRPLAAEFEEVYRVGGMNAPEWAFFEGSEPIGFDGAGNLYVLDGQAGQVVVIDPEGRLVRTVGRKGEGPGEFNLPADLFVWRDGRFAVQDMGHAAYQVFGPTGELEQFVGMGGGGSPLTMVGAMRLEMRADPAGGALIAQGMPSMMGAMTDIFEELGELLGESVETPETGVDDHGLERFSLDEDGASWTPVLQGWSPPREEMDRKLSLEDFASDPSSMVGLADNLRYFDPLFVWDVLPDGTIAYSDSTTYAVKLARPGEAVADVLRRPFSPAAVTDRIRRETIAQSLQEFEEVNDDPEIAELLGADNPMLAGMRDAYRKQAENREFYPEVQVLVDLRATWDGALWVVRTGGNLLDDEGPIDVFGANREYVGTFAEEDYPMPAAFGPNGMVVFWEFDELDVPTIVVKRLPVEVR